MIAKDDSFHAVMAQHQVRLVFQTYNNLVASGLVSPGDLKVLKEIGKMEYAELVRALCISHGLKEMLGEGNRR